MKKISLGLVFLTAAACADLPTTPDDIAEDASFALAHGVPTSGSISLSSWWDHASSGYNFSTGEYSARFDRTRPRPEITTMTRNYPHGSLLAQREGLMTLLGHGLYSTADCSDLRTTPYYHGVNTGTGLLDIRPVPTAASVIGNAFLLRTNQGLWVKLRITGTGAGPGGYGRAVNLDYEVLGCPDDAPLLGFDVWDSFTDRNARWLVNGRIVDPGSSQWSFRVDYGDGTPVEEWSGGWIRLEHRFPIEGDVTVSATIEDESGNTHTTSFAMHIKGPAEIAGELIEPLRRRVEYQTHVPVGRWEPLFRLIDVALRQYNSGSHANAMRSVGLARDLLVRIDEQYDIGLEFGVELWYLDRLETAVSP